MTSPETNRILLGLLLGVTAAGANVLGGSLIAHGQWSRRYLKYFIALGAGFMLATALLEMIPESLKLRGDHESFFFHDTSSVFLLVLAGYFLVHFFEHTLAPHFHFGEETHHDEISHAHASYAALLGLGIHTLFDGVAIASGLLVSTSLGILIFFAIFLHKLPEGFTVASLMLASGQSRRAAFVSSVILGGCTLLGMALMFALRSTVQDALAAVGGRHALRRRLGPDSRGEPRASVGHGRAGFPRSSRHARIESPVPPLVTERAPSPLTY